MSRPKGSKNFGYVKATVTETEESFEPLNNVEVKQEEKAPKYICVEAQTDVVLEQLVNALIDKYDCQGGVSVTNYRGLDGNIVMVYAQAMIRKE